MLATLSPLVGHCSVSVVSYARHAAVSAGAGAGGRGSVHPPPPPRGGAGQQLARHMAGPPHPGHTAASMAECSRYFLLT